MLSETLPLDKRPTEMKRIQFLCHNLSVAYKMEPELPVIDHGHISTGGLCTNFYPLPLSHFVTHIGTPSPKVRHTSRNPQFLVVHVYIHMSLEGLVLVLGGF